MSIIHGMSNAEYHADTSAISASGLKLFMRSPAHYYAAYLDPNRIERQPTTAMRLGTATHCAILEPDAFDDRYMLRPDGINARTAEGKAQLAAIAESGIEILTPDDFALITGMADSFRRHPISADLFAAPHKVEQSIFAEINGVRCKCRPDYISGDFIMDVKTTRDASIEGFGKQAWNLGYHIQEAFYRRVIGGNHRFLFGAVESDYPHLVQYHESPDELIAYADDLIDAALSHYAECLRKNEWPGYSNNIQPLEVPGYAKRMIEGFDGEVEVNYV